MMHSRPASGDAGRRHPALNLWTLVPQHEVPWAARTWRQRRRYRRGTATRDAGHRGSRCEDGQLGSDRSHLGPLRRRLAVAVFALALLLGACTEASLSPPEPSPATPTPAAVAAPSVTPPVAPTATPLPPAARGITILAIGDVMLDRDVEALIVEHGDGYPWSRVSGLFDGADIVLANLERTFTARGSATKERYTFRRPRPWRHAQRRGDRCRDARQ